MGQSMAQNEPDLLPLHVRSSIVEAVTRDGEHLSLTNTFGVTGPRFLRPAGTREADGECLHVPLSQEIGRHLPRYRVLKNNVCQPAGL